MGDHLGEYDGQPITKVKMRLTRAGDGLSAAMSLDPVWLHLGEEIDLVVRAKVAHVDLRPVDTDVPLGDLVQVVTLEAIDAARAEDAAVTMILARSREAIQRAKGNEPLPGMGVEDGDDGE